MDEIGAHTVSTTKEQRGGEGEEQKSMKSTTPSPIIPNALNNQEYISKVDHKMEKEMKNNFETKPLEYCSDHQPTVVQDHPTTIEKNQQIEGIKKEKSKVKSRFGGLFNRMDKHRKERSTEGEDHRVTKYTEKDEK
jgi:hypothetical protein